MLPRGGSQSCLNSSRRAHHVGFIESEAVDTLDTSDSGGEGADPFMSHAFNFDPSAGRGPGDSVLVMGMTPSSSGCCCRRSSSHS